MARTITAIRQSGWDYRCPRLQRAPGELATSKPYLCFLQERRAISCASYVKQSGWMRIARCYLDFLSIAWDLNLRRNGANIQKRHGGRAEKAGRDNGNAPRHAPR